MNIKLIHRNIIDNSTSELFIKAINKDQSLEEICHEIPNSGTVLSFERYYDFCKDLMWNDHRLPYILRNGKVEWGIPYSNISINNFIETHSSIINEGLYFESGYVMAGGPGYIEFHEMWQNAYPIIKNIANNVGIIISFLASAATLESWARDKFSKRKDTPFPQSFIEFIYTKFEWNHFELAQILQIDNQDAKDWLKLLGYKWSPKKQMYIISSEDIKKQKDKLNNIKYLDI